MSSLLCHESLSQTLDAFPSQRNTMLVSPGPGCDDTYLRRDSATIEYPIFENDVSTSSSPSSPLLDSSSSSSSPVPVRVIVTAAGADVDSAVSVAQAILAQHMSRTDFKHQPECKEKWLARCGCFEKYCCDPTTNFSKSDVQTLFGSQMAPGWVSILAMNERSMDKTFFDVTQAMVEHGVSMECIPFVLLQMMILATDESCVPAVQRLGDVLARLPYADGILRLPDNTLMVSDASLVLMRPSLLKQAAVNGGAAALYRRSFGGDTDALLSALAASENAVDVLQSGHMEDVTNSACRWMLDVANLATVLVETKVPLLCGLVAAGFDAQSRFDFRSTLFNSLVEVAQHGGEGHREHAVRAILACRKIPMFDKILSARNKRAVDDVVSVAMSLAFQMSGATEGARKKR